MICITSNVTLTNFSGAFRRILRGFSETVELSVITIMLLQKHMIKAFLKTIHISLSRTTSAAS